MQNHDSYSNFDLSSIRQIRVLNGLAEVLVGDEWIETKITYDELKEIIESDSLFNLQERLNL